MNTTVIACGAVLIAGLAGVWLLLPDSKTAPVPQPPASAGTMSAPAAADAPTVSVRVPALSETALAGKSVFDANCAVCHGAYAAGTRQGPPLVHKIYEPGHHGDISFLLAVRSGVRAHHWPYGNMPPVEGVDEAQVGRIVAYVRELQRANGIN